MYDYKITPKQPLIFRDGKPFGTEDNMAETLPFPQPSTIAGAMRTAWAENNDRNYKKAAKKSVCSPLLLDNKTNQLLFPAPADSVCLKPENEEKNYIYRLQPEKVNNEEGGTDLPDGLSPVFMVSDVKGKPAKDAPKLWHYEKMLNWLKDDSTNGCEASTFGIQNLPIETRTHVAINSYSLTAETGHLFQTAGLDFGNQRKQNEQTGHSQKQWGWKDESYSLACQFQEKIPSTLRTIGGEARLGKIQPQENLFPDCPNDIATEINQKKAFRLLLVTPAIFENGYLPKWLDSKTLEGELHGMRLRLHAVAVPRWQAGTSWDMAADGSRKKVFDSKKGKGMRALKRLAPAGTVYWFEILDGVMEAEGFWLTTISDERANDGYGLTLSGVWAIENFKKDK